MSWSFTNSSTSRVACILVAQSMDSDLHGQPLQLAKVIHGITHCRNASAWCFLHKRTWSTSTDNPEGGEEQTSWDDIGRQATRFKCMPESVCGLCMHILSTAAKCKCVEWIVKEKEVWSDRIKNKAMMKYHRLNVIEDYNMNMNSRRTSPTNSVAAVGRTGGGGPSSFGQLVLPVWMPTKFTRYCTTRRMQRRRWGSLHGGHMGGSWKNSFMISISPADWRPMWSSIQSQQATRTRQQERKHHQFAHLLCLDRETIVMRECTT